MFVLGEDGDILGKFAYRLKLDEDIDEENELDSKLARKMSRLHINEQINYEDDFDYNFSESDDDDDLSFNTNSPIPDDTKCNYILKFKNLQFKSNNCIVLVFFNEVIESLTRGFEDQLLCENLVLEINSSRYAYNVTVKEVVIIFIKINEIIKLIYV